MLVDNLRIITFNCNSMKKNIDVIRTLLNDCDVLCLQETLIYDNDDCYLDRIDNRFNFTLSPCTSANVIAAGRPKGGLITFWRKTLNSHVEPVINSQRYLGIKLSSTVSKYLILNVYMPYDNGSIENVVTYREVLSEITNEIDCLNDQLTLVVTGDFNSSPRGGRFWGELTEFCDDLNLVVADLILPQDSFTFLSGAHDSTSWIDHVLISRQELISSIEVRYHDNIFDHFPLSFQLTFDTSLLEVVNEQIDTEKFVNWNRLSHTDICAYQANILHGLDFINLECINCCIYMCTDNAHRVGMRNTYLALIDLMLSSSEKFMISRSSPKKFTPVPGWNSRCKGSHYEARKCFLDWKNQGRPRSGPYYDDMKESRTIFRRDLKFCKENDENLRNDKIMESLKSKDMGKFWSRVRVKNKRDCSNMVDNESSVPQIALNFKSKYSAILNNPICQTSVESLDNRLLNALKNGYGYQILPSEFDKAISDLNTGIGHDNVHSNHLKHSPAKFRYILNLLFNCMIMHGYIPDEMLTGIIIPRVKNKLGNLCDSNNYRPVMISSNMLKLFEYCLMPSLNEKLILHENQFGFVKNSSTVMSATVLKEVIQRYVNNGSKVFGAFIDLSRAFDCVNHNVLINNIIDRGVNPMIVQVLKYMYTRQTFAVSWNGHMTNHDFIRNGVRQGGVTSPILFNVYIDNLVRKINEMQFGCRLGPYKFGLLAYADDLICISPTLSGLQCMVNEIFNDLEDLCLKPNSGKSKSMIFENRRAVTDFELYLGNNKLEVVQQYTYLGIVLKSNLKNDADIARCTKSFLKQFNCMYRRFYYVNLAGKLFLFRTYCMSFYGCETWYNTYGCSAQLKELAISYHKAIKRLHGIPYRTSNHDICDESNLLTFKHYLSQRLLDFVFRIRRSSFLGHLNYFLLRKSALISGVTARFREIYEVDNILDNDLQALKARIKFISDHEPRFVRPDFL